MPHNADSIPFTPLHLWVLGSYQVTNKATQKSGKAVPMYYEMETGWFKSSLIEFISICTLAYVFIRVYTDSERKTRR